MQTCNKCGRDLALISDNFHKKSDTKTGFRSTCKECRKIESKKRHVENYGVNKEIILKKKRDYYKNNPEKQQYQNKKYYHENIEYNIKRHKEYHQENKDIINKKTRERYKINKNEINARRREITKKWSPEKKKKISLKMSVYVQKRRAKILELGHDFSLSDWNQCKNHFDERCCYCGKFEKLQQDHFIPLSKGGSYTVSNIVPACNSCNASKNNSDFFDWYPKQEYYSKARETKILTYLQINNQLSSTL
jgi:hypothetical protein